MGSFILARFASILARRVAVKATLDTEVDAAFERIQSKSEAMDLDLVNVIAALNAVR